MTRTGTGEGAAPSATVSTRELDPRDVQGALEREADEAERAVETIEAKLEGWKRALKAAKDRARQARVAATEGRAE